MMIDFNYIDVPLYRHGHSHGGLRHGWVVHEHLPRCHGGLAVGLLDPVTPLEAPARRARLEGKVLARHPLALCRVQV